MTKWGYVIVDGNNILFKIPTKGLKKKIIKAIVLYCVLEQAILSFGVTIIMK